MLRSGLANLLLAGAALAAVAIACGSDPTPTPAPTLTATPRPSAAPTGAQPTGTPGAKPKTYSAPPPMTIDANKKYTATLVTNKGAVRIDLLAKQAPETVNSFVFLARDGYFTGIKFHRVINGFMMQGGDPLTVDDAAVARWGTGSPGYTIPDEFMCTNGTIVNTLRPTCSLATTFDKAGLLAMANTGAPRTGGSQFFITLAPTTHLNGGHTIFGQVIEGQSVVNSIGAASTECTRTGRQEPQCSSRPDQPVIIQSVTIQEQ